ncbi:MAG: insulinase family protein [Saprospiraceae bacterium]|nr:insulinase family protein [Saprospiraceae bacterium]
MKKTIPNLLLCMLLPMISYSQTRLIEKVVKKSNDEIVIPYEKYVLDNGLTLVIHEDHSDPVCHVDVTYHVGSAREEIGKSGFAHFFEHMMFQGSDNVADEQHFKLITESGGTLNGSTNRDRTNYYETVPSNQVEKMIWLEADRMGFLLDAVTQKKFEIQRATVKNERGQNYDNRPYGLVQEMIAKNLYPYGHPYSWLTIGYVEDLNRVDVNDLKNFFMRWYGPNNAVITVGGDVKAADIVKYVEKYFGSIPRGPEVEKTILPDVQLTEDRYVSMVDNFAKLPQLVCAMPTVPRYHKDEAAVDCLSQILGGDNNSILYQSLVKTQKALNASAFNPTSELGGNIYFAITPKPGTPLSDMEEELNKALVDFEKRGVSDDDISKFKSSFEATAIYRLESVSGKVSQLAAYETFTGNPNYLQTELKDYLSFTKEDVMRVYNEFVKGKHKVILSVLTKGNEMLIAKESNYTIDTTKYVAPDYGYEGLKYNKPKDNFDRSVIPGEGPAPVVKVPEFKKTTKGSMKIIESMSTEIPTIVLRVELKGGRMVEQNDLSKVGVSELFTTMMDEDTKLHTAEEISVLLDKLGSSISINTTLDNTIITVRTLKKNLKPTLALMEERLLSPKFTSDAFDRIKNKAIEDIKNSKTNAANVASQAYDMMLYGPKNILGQPSSGTEATVAKITLADIEMYYKKYISRNGANIIVVGDIDKAGMTAITTSLMKLPNKAVNLPILPKAMTSAEKNTVYVVDIPKAAQTEFRVGYLTDLKYDATGGYYKSSLMNYVFGGSFNGRININLREDKGWTYGARSNFLGNDYTGSFTFSSGIKSSATDSALMEVVTELDNYSKNGITMDELKFLKSAISQSEARRYETGFQKASFLGNMLKYKLAPNYTVTQNGILNNITAKEINLLSAKYMDPQKMNIIFAGDKEKIAPTLEKMGYKVQDINSQGEVVEVKP